MIAPESNIRTVHVLRHTFRPNEALAEQLGEFIIKKPRQTVPRFLLASTRAVAVDAVHLHQHQYESEVHRIEGEFFKNMGGVVLGAIGNRMDPYGNLHLRFSPKDMLGFIELTDPIDTLYGIEERSERNDRYYLSLTLGRQALESEGTLKSAWTRLRTSFQKNDTTNLFSAYPNDISGPQRTAQIDYVQVPYE